MQKARLQVIFFSYLPLYFRLGCYTHQPSCLSWPETGPVSYPFPIWSATHASQSRSHTHTHAHFFQPSIYLSACMLSSSSACTLHPSSGCCTLVAASIACTDALCTIPLSACLLLDDPTTAIDCVFVYTSVCGRRSLN